MILTTADVVDTVAKEMMAAKKKGGGANNGGDKSQQQQKNNYVSRPNNNNGNNRKRNGSLISNGNEEGIMPDLEIVGPMGITTFLHSLRHFMRRDRFKVHVHEGQGQYDSALKSNNASA